MPSIGYIPTDKPEGLTLLADGSMALISDNDFTQGGFSEVSLGIITFDDEGNQLDPSNEDGGVNIGNWPVHGLFMPDAIATYQVDGFDYIVTANEGDGRDYDGFSDEDRVADLTLDPEAFPDAATLQLEENLGRLKTPNTEGDIDSDGDVDRIFSYGARSFTIFDTFGNLVFDSGDDFEKTIAAEYPEYFNSSNDETGLDDRSDDKGPEPEAVALGTIDGRTYAFIGIERFGGVFVYDITVPSESFYVTSFNNRDFEADPESEEAGDLGPEGMVFIPASESPNRKPLLVVA
ncbi:choice-of-anchor I family protein, partial [Puniceicoccaceae bacterium K14]|nr:choice-of-anchor I family protein [Puniceicoccaceae bacterium K14]